MPAIHLPHAGFVQPLVLQKDQKDHYKQKDRLSKILQLFVVIFRHNEFPPSHSH